MPRVAERAGRGLRAGSGLGMAAVASKYSRGTAHCGKRIRRIASAFALRREAEAQRDEASSGNQQFIPKAKCDAGCQEIVGRRWPRDVMPHHQKVWRRELFPPGMTLIGISFDRSRRGMSSPWYADHLRQIRPAVSCFQKVALTQEKLSGEMSGRYFFSNRLYHNFVKLR